MRMFGTLVAVIVALTLIGLFAPIATSTLFAGIIHLFIMAALSSFPGLGLFILVGTFSITYLFAAPRHLGGQADGFGAVSGHCLKLK